MTVYSHSLLLASLLWHRGKQTKYDGKSCNNNSLILAKLPSEAFKCAKPHAARHNEEDTSSLTESGCYKPTRFPPDLLPTSSRCRSRRGCGQPGALLPQEPAAAALPQRAGACPQRAGARWHWEPRGWAVVTALLSFQRHLVASTTFLGKSG